MDDRCDKPWYGGEWRVQAGKMKSLRTAVTADQLSPILTCCTLVIIDVGLHREILIINRPAAGLNSMETLWTLYSICEWLLLVVKNALNSFGSSVGLL